MYIHFVRKVFNILDYLLPYKVLGIKKPSKNIPDRVTKNPNERFEQFLSHVYMTL